MFARFGIGLRALVFLRRIAIAMERQATALESLARNDLSRWEHDFAPRPHGRAKSPDISTLDVAEVQRRWDRMQEAAATGVEYEDVT